jgi:hypothetical protein
MVEAGVAIGAIVGAGVVAAGAIVEAGALAVGAGVTGVSLGSCPKASRTRAIEPRQVRRVILVFIL